MSVLNINPKDIIFALDIGTRSIIGTVGVVKDKKFNVICEKYIEHEERAMIDGQIHDINLVANSVNAVKKAIEEKINLNLKEAAIAAAGRFLRTTDTKVEIEVDDDKEIDREIIRSLELTAVKRAEEKINKEAEGKLYCVGYSVKNYYLNGYLISNLLSQKGERISAEVIATFLPKSVIDSLYTVMNKVGLNVTSLTLEPIAAMEAAVPKKLRLLNIALVDVGAGTSDIAISSNDSISAYGMVPMAGDEVTEAIVQNYLVDFNTGEVIKKDAANGKTSKYIDVLGLEGEVSPEDVIKVIEPIVAKITDEIAKKIIELNGGKATSVVFLVGGGAHTPYLKEALAKKLNLPIQRIAIKGRDAVEECVGYDETLGSAGVTVLGIALNAIKRSGNDFINVTLNNEVISLFNSHKHTVMDVMLQAGISHKALIGKNGKNIRFTLNGIKRVAFGSLGQGAEILVNGKNATIDTEVKDGDNIEVIFAKNGKDASPKILEYVKSINSISFYLNDIIQNLEPVVFINGNRGKLEDNINEGDIVQIIFPKSLEDYIKYFRMEYDNYTYYLKDEKIDKSHIIEEGERIYAKLDEEEDDEKLTDNSPKVNKILNEIKVYVNDKQVILSGKEKYIFVDVFNHIQFDLSVPKGNLMITLNDNKAGYYDELKDGDIIRIFWEKD
ncbi:cell division protein FtsA [Clostridium sp.]|uniref:cell division protein FtsA n=1 Tax=Clostridium sp. TaxID=1506 RepID=UPI0039F4837D